MSGNNEKYPNLRRIVTGHDDEGRSIAMIDELCNFQGAGGDGWRFQDIWSHDSTQLRIDAREPDPTLKPIGRSATGIRVRITDLPPTPAGAEPYIHRTKSVDYLHVLEGEVTMLFDDEDHEVVLRKGDTLVQRATNHAWVNRTDTHCRLFIVMIFGEISESLEQSIGVVPDWPPPPAPRD